LDGFEKLINEHGSATILKERIVLINEKYSALEKDLSASKSREADLTAENQSLVLDNAELRQEIQRRDDIIQEYKSHDNHLDEAKVNILKLLFNHPKLSDEQIVHSLDILPPVAVFHLTELKESKMVKRVISGSAMRPEGGWSLDQEGTRYLLEQNLV
jgi:chromosome segregation ATPase